jgi:hypothetical protein
VAASRRCPTWLIDAGFQLVSLVTVAAILSLWN